MLSYLFPKGSLGIEITTKYVRFVHLIKKGTKVHLENFGRILIPQDIFFDGVLQKPEDLKNILKKILRESREKQIRISIPGESQRFFFIQIKQGSKESLVDDIVFHLKERVLFHEGKDSVADIRILEADKEYVRAKVAIAPSLWFQKIQKVFSVFSHSNLHIDGFNQAGVFAFQSKETISKTILHIQFGDDISSFSIIEKGIIVSYQEFPFSTHRFLLEIQKRLTKPSDIASSYLSHRGIFGADVREFSENALKSITFLIDRAILEYGRDTGHVVHQVTLGGVFAGYQGVSETLSKYLRISVQGAYPFHGKDSHFNESFFNMKKAETLEYLTALGLALDGVK